MNRGNKGELKVFLSWGLKGQIFPIISTEEVLLIMKLLHYHRMRTQSYYYLRLCFLDRFKLA